MMKELKRSNPACCFLPLAAFDYAAAQNVNIDLASHLGTPSIWPKNGKTSNLAIFILFYSNQRDVIIKDLLTSM
jgi:hypothetical protein